MKIGMKEGTKETENFIVELYYCSIDKSNTVKAESAQFTIDIILFFFTLLSIYTNENHFAIVSSLYFSNENIKEIGVRNMANKLFMEERTLYTHRKKYCKIISSIIEFVKKYTK